MGSWNGLMGALVNKQTDMVLSALKVDWPIRYVALDVCVEKDVFYGRIVLRESTVSISLFFIFFNGEKLC